MAHSPSEMGVVGTRACDEVESHERSKVVLMMSPARFLVICGGLISGTGGASPKIHDVPSNSSNLDNLYQQR